jgi:peptidoglycan/LPS O-acetylase OafA/YrhL
MAETTRDTRRVGWLDGLRGIAAMQVVLLHYACVFLPAIGFHEPGLAHFSWESAFIRTPLGFLFDGASAVFLFFIMSGVALTHAFNTRPFAFRREVSRRLIRLGLPMATAILFGAALLSLMPDAHLIAGERTGSSALLYMGPHEISLISIIHQIMIEGLLAGFGDVNLLPPWASAALHLVPRAQAFNSPLWSLHFEFYGSLLVLVLVTLRTSPTRIIYPAGCIIVGLLSFSAANPLSLFLLGHVAAQWLPRFTGRLWQAVLGVALEISGILLCSADKLTSLSATLGWLFPSRVLQPDYIESMQKMTGAVLIFSGLALLPSLQRHLEQPVMRWLGKMSFSLYLVHFPILFTCVAANFTLLDRFLPYGISVAIASLTGIAASLLAAIPFERWIDRPAITLSRWAGRPHRRVDLSVTYVPVADHT